MNFAIAAAQSASIAGDIARNVQRHLWFAGMAADLGTRLIVFPELSLTGYELVLARECAEPPDSRAFEPLRRFAEDARMTIVAGAPVPNGTGGLYLAALIFSPNGGVDVYAKQHVHSSEELVFTAGPGGATLRVAEATVALAICRDAAQPEHAAEAASRGANVYAVGAMIDKAGYARKASLLAGFAKAHGMAVLLANYAGATGGDLSAGGSAVWKPNGELAARCEGNEEALVLATCDGAHWSGRVVPAR